VKRILFVDEAEGFGGSLVVAGTLIDGLKEAGYSAVVIVPFRDRFIQSRLRSAERVFIRRSLCPYTRAKALRAKAGKLKSAPLRALADLFISAFDSVSSALHAVSIALTVLRSGASIVHSNNSSEAIVAGLLTRRPVVFHLHGFGRQRLGLLRRCRVVAVSRCVREYATDKGLSESSVEMIYNGVSVTDKSGGSTMSGGFIRSQLNVPDSAPLVGLVGRVVRWKGHEEFVEAAYLVSKECPDAHFVFVGDVSDGDSAYLDTLMSRVRELGLENRLRCTGFVNDVESYVRELSVLVHASIEPEPFGLVIVEGMAIGKPVIASNRGAGPEIIVDGVNGYLVDPCDHEQLAKRIVALLQDATLASRVGERARQYVEERFSAQEMTRKFIHLYRSVDGAR